MLDLAMTPPFATVRDGDPCPCGSGIRFDGCCAPALRGVPAPTAEALMRSRYTAFVVGDAAYLSATWHPGTRPETDIQHSFQRALDDIRTHSERSRGQFTEELRAFPRAQGAGS